MRSRFALNIFRSIKDSLGRFIALVGIVALGCGFYAGLRMTAPDMDLAADIFFDESNLMDIRVVSTLGLSEDDLRYLAHVDGVDEVQGGFETDVYVDLNDEQYAMRMHSLPYRVGDADDPSDETQASPSGADASTEDDDIASEIFPVADSADEAQAVATDSSTLNKLTLIEGEWPTEHGQCIISADNVMNSPVQIGDKILITQCSSDIEGTIKYTEYTIVGLAHSPYYACTTAMGTTSLGRGTLDQFMYVPADDFSDDYPITEAFLLVDGAKDEFYGSEDYTNVVDNVLSTIEDDAPRRESLRRNLLVADAQASLDESRAQYEQERSDAEAELTDAREQLDSAAATLQQSRSDIATAQSEYDNGVAELASQRAQAQEQFDQTQAQLDSIPSTIDQLDSQIAQVQAQVDSLTAQGTSDDALQQQLQQLQQQRDELNAQYESGTAELASSRAQAEEQFAQAQAQLDSAASQLASARQQLSSGQSEYDSGLAEYEQNYATAQDEFAQAEAELADAQAEIDDIGQVEWLVMDRSKNPGVVSFSSDADRIDSIASFFPFIFFLVAALVALTTMTRFVEEDRQLIGTLAALGYSKARISSKYLIYAGLASVIGAVLGIVALSLILPPTIMNAYAIIYNVPHDFVVPIDLSLSLLSGGLGICITLISTWAAVISTLRDTPAALMLPKAPKAGKRILLERIGPLWRRISFSGKVTCRNIFRYKRRLVMTLIGIAGCTGLLLTGLGLYNSVNDIIDKQFGQTVLYNVQVTGDEAFSDDARSSLTDLAPSSAFAQVESMLVTQDGADDTSVSVVVPEDPDEFCGLWVMRDRVSKDPIEFDQDSIVITEKLSYMFNVGVGDDITIAEQDDMGNATSTRYALTITGIMENYVANYIFIGQEAYEQEFGEDAQFSSMYANVGDSEDEHDTFRESASAIEGVNTISFNDEVIEAYRHMLDSVNIIVVILVVAAALLAAIVLYNLTNINICERTREIATLKVLGFRPREVNTYIYREIMLLTIIGALIGLAFGVFLEGYVVVTAEVDYVMFGREIHALSFILAFAATIVFAMVVLAFMRPKLARIDMIESLKSVE